MNVVHGVLDTPQTHRVSDISGGADHKKLAKGLVKHQFRGDPTVGAGQDNDVGMLAGCQLAAKRNQGMGLRSASDKALVAGHKAGPDLVRRWARLAGGCRMGSVWRPSGGWLLRQTITHEQEQDDYIRKRAIHGCFPPNAERYQSRGIGSNPLNRTPSSASRRKSDRSAFFAEGLYILAEYRPSPL